MTIQKKIDSIYEKADKRQKSFDFNEDKKIDLNNLHTEQQRHSEKCFGYNERRSKMKSVVGQLEELKKQTRSKLVNDCIADPSLCDPTTKKYSDKKAESYYRLHSEYQEVVTVLLAAQHEFDTMEGMQRIMEDEGWRLKDCVVLALSQYFESTETKETRVVHDVQNNQLDEVDDIIQKAPEKIKTAGAEKDTEPEKPNVPIPAGPIYNKEKTPRRRKRK